MNKFDKPAEKVERYDLRATLIHDLRTPLSQIIGYSEMIMEQAEDAGNDEYKASLKKIRAAGYQMLGLISENFRASTPDPIPPLTLPIKVPPAQAEPEPDLHLPPAIAKLSPDAEPSGPAHGFLLVVDDIEMNRDLLTRRLEGQGYTVATAENGREALEMLAAEDFDLVLLDIMMPEVSGYEVLQHMKADLRLRHVPVIMISALSELDSVARCIEMGAEDYLPKPFNPVLLKARIGASLVRKRMHDRQVRLFNELQRNYDRLQELERLRGETA